MQKSFFRALFLFAPCALFALFPLLACGGSGDGASPDASPADGVDAGAPLPDASPGAPDDASPGADAGADATVESTSDGGDATASSTPDAQATDAPTDDGGATTPDAGSNDDASDASDASDAGTALIRVAHLSTSLAPIDFCIAPAGQPMVGAPYMTSVGATAGLAYTNVSEYVAFPAGPTYVVRVVSAGSTTCATALPGIADARVTGGTEIATVALAGSGASADAGATADAGALAPTLRTFADDPPYSTVDIAYGTRFIHAAPHAAPVDLTVGAGDVVAPLQVGVAYGQTSSTATEAPGAPAPDANGYVVVRNIGMEIFVKEGSSTIGGYGAWTNATAFLVGDDTTSAPLGFLQCQDNGVPGGGGPSHQTYCVLGVDPITADPVLAVDLGVDATGVDVCLRVQDFGPWVGPLAAKAGVSSGLSYLRASGTVAEVSEYTTFDSIWVPAGQPCDYVLPIVSSTVPIETSNGYTLALVLAESMGDPSPAYSTYDTAFLVPSDAATASLTIDDAYEVGGELVYIDVYDTPSGATTPALLGTMSGSFFPQLANASLAPGTYALSFVEGTTTMLSVPSVTVSAGQRWQWYLFEDTAAVTHLARCNLAPPAAGTLVTCSD